MAMKDSYGNYQVLVDLSGSPSVPAIGGAAANVFYYDGNPNGHVTASGPAEVIGIGASLGSRWVKSTAGTTNNEWDEVIAAP